MSTEKPILFNSEMVRAILDGRKTMTRRVVKPMSKNQAEWLTPELINSVPHGEMIKGGWQMHHPRADTDYMGVHVEHDSPLGWVRCPYGQPGDLLWVRETFLIKLNGDAFYRADDPTASGWNSGSATTKWRPSIFMPRWASRITLRVFDVRVERVQEISVSDMRAEGVAYGPARPGEFSIQSTVREWENLWDSINAKRGYSWNSNPWVWVVSFEMVQRNGGNHANN